MFYPDSSFRSVSSRCRNEKLRGESGGTSDIALSSARVPCAPNILLSHSHCDSVSGANMILASWKRSPKYSCQDDFLFWQKWLRYLPDVTVVPGPPCTRYTHDPFRRHTAASLHATAIWLWDRTENTLADIAARKCKMTIFAIVKKLTAK